MITSCHVFFEGQNVEGFELDTPHLLRLQDIAELILIHRRMFGFQPNSYVVPTGVEWSTALTSSFELNESFFLDAELAKVEGLSGTAGFLDFTLCSKS